jgi:2-desacetyl-2-hydroxyethyl bacteriochlorophyllide A dehydrogenase
VEVREESFAPPGAGEVVVAARLSAVSAGTEMLVYRGRFPAALTVDASIGALARPFAYPLKYGYAMVGTVVRRGKGVSRAWEGRRVFVLHPHESHFVCPVADLCPLPGTVSDEDAVFLPFMETAVTLLMDGRPLIGEEVAVFGQGVVGLLTTMLLARFPLGRLVTFDRHAVRRERSRQLGAVRSLDPREGIGRVFSGDGADLVFELSGNPAALNLALAATGFAGRVIVGSWYGSAPVSLDLGGRFHRSRIAVAGSQVSTIAPGYQGRWTRQRRLQAALALVAQVRPAGLITHRVPFRDARRAYGLIARHPEEVIQTVLTYGG